ncbi:MAG: FAD-dependent oxidoreductase [Firmicutes bacterium]|nr:FAD-dependent oxidoreductase [Bacillota bacterium]
MCKIIVIGGGWAGCSAALRARKAGADVTLLEKTDMLLGLGNVGGIMRNNGRFTAAEENIALGNGELFEITDKLALHKNVDFPGHKHASFYDVAMIEPEVRRFLESLGIKIKTMTRVVDVMTCGKSLEGVVDAAGNIYMGDAFVETTGSTGPMGNCMRYGNGCSMCILRCPSFGPRVSVTQRCGLDDVFAYKEDGTVGAFSGSCKLEKRTLSKKLQKRLSKDGYAVVPLPDELVNREKMNRKVCRQYALDAYAENVILIDTGHAKLMTPFFNLEDLRKVEGFENVRFADPYAGGKGNSVRYMSVGIRDEYMRARGMDNLFLGGEKSGFFVGHTEALTTGALAGFNAVKFARGEELLRLPEDLATGDILAYAQEVLLQKDGMDRRFTFAGGEYFERMKKKGLYSTDSKTITKKVESLGLLNVYNEG